MACCHSDGEIIVKFKAGVDPKNYLEGLGFPLKLKTEFEPGYYLVTVPVGTENIFATLLSWRHEVEYAGTNRIGKLD